jgi:hypothetical protein
MSIFQEQNRSANPRRSFWMTGSGIFNAMRIVKDNHLRNKVPQWSR